MSVDKMSANVKAHIVERLQAVIEKSSAGPITERKLNNFIDYTSRDQIRRDTDTVGGRHESIMSRGAFNTLLSDMSTAISNKQLSDELTSIVTTASFDNFVAFISNVYYKDKEFLLTNNKRIKNGFMYIGPTRDTKDSVAIFAKSQVAGEENTDVLLLKNIPQRKLVDYYVEYLTSVVPGISKEAAKELNKSLQGGHLTGVFTARLVRAFSLDKDLSGVVSYRGSSISNLTDFEKQLGAIVTLVTDADFLSSNIYSDMLLFTETDKRLYSNSAEVRLTMEVQFANSNKEAGDMLTTAGTYLSKLIASINPNTSKKGQTDAAEKAFKNLLLNLKKVSLYVKDRAEQIKKLESSNKLDPKLKEKLEKVLANQESFNTLITTEGSPSLVAHLTNIVKAGITGTKVSKSKSTAKVVGKSSLPKNTKSNTALKSNKTKPIKLVLKEPAIKAIRNSTSDLTSLQTLINTHLQDVISANMGNGNDKKILNYRTGRFAASARVERMSESRAGMITAFYSYMKNPYQTFEPGFRQGSPNSRDPKLLIGTSIKEIAATKVGARLRAVLV